MRSPVTLDFETYYDNDYTLKKLTTEAYIRDPRFKAHGVGVLADGQFTWITEDIGARLEELQLDQRPVIMQHAHFDGLILSHHYGIHPKVFLDTLSMGRALGLQRIDLSGLAMRYGMGTKMADRLEQTRGVRDLSPGQLGSLGEYCEHDVLLTHMVFDAMRGEFPVNELLVIDAVVKMFTRPLLQVDGDIARATALAEVARTEDLLVSMGVDREDLMSNPRFAALLSSLGVPPPMKVSPTTGKPTLALSKTDKAFTALLGHPDPRVEELVRARLGMKSTIMRTRAESFADIAARTAAAISAGKKDTETGWPVYLRYSGARQTHRFSGADGVNPQNLNRGSLLRKAVTAPAGHVIVACDSSNIELRVNMTMAGQTNVVDALRQGRDLYCEFASLRYGRPITKKDKLERQYGKICHLALGYGMGAEKFVETARLNNLTVTPAEADETVALYRDQFLMVPQFWNRAKAAIPYMRSGTAFAVDQCGLVYTGSERLTKPAGMPLLYQNLREQPREGWGTEWVYDGYDEETGKPRARRLYGGKLVENIVQSVARDIVAEQLVAVAKRYPVVMQVHDEIIIVVPRKEADAAAQFMLDAMSTSPVWFPQVPLAAEADFSFRYGDCK